MDRYRLDSGKVYLDNAATSLKTPAIIRKLYDYSIMYPINPFSMKEKSQDGEFLLDNARVELLNHFDLDEQNFKVIFTSGATEGINLIMQGLYFSRKKTRIISSHLEHKAVLENLNYLESLGAEIIYIPHDENGVLDMNKLSKLINENTSFVTLMHVNNEIGTINAIGEAAKTCINFGVPFFSDTTQSVGKLGFYADYLDAFVGSAHKFGGPFGVGFLVYRVGLLSKSVLHGGSQEYGLRPGTHNLPGILTMIEALSVRIELDREFVQNVMVELNLNMADRIGEHCCDYIYAFPVDDINRFELLNSNYILGRGSACNSGLSTPSHVYSALGYDENVVRISF